MRCNVIAHAPCNTCRAALVAGAKIGLIDYGQSKQLPLHAKLTFAQLIHDLDEGNEDNILTALQGLGVRLQAGEPATASRMAYGMFDTRGRQVLCNQVLLLVSFLTRHESCSNVQSMLGSIHVQKWKHALMQFKPCMWFLFGHGMPARYP